MALDFRNLRYFVAVAEELHFSRAAERLYIAQPALSEQISRLERDLGVQLLRRTTRKVELTPAGEEFLERARRILAEADEAMAAAGRAARGESGRIRIGTLATGGVDLVPRIMRSFREQRPEVEVELVDTPWTDHSAGLKDGSADVAFLWTEFERDGIELAPLVDEQRYAALAADHPLAGEPALEIAQLAEEPWPWTETDPIALEYWVCAEHRPGQDLRSGPHVASMGAIMESVQAGLGVAAVPSSAVRSQAYAGIAFVPITDIPPATVALGWRQADETPVVQAFVEIARAAIAAPAD